MPHLKLDGLFYGGHYFYIANILINNERNLKCSITKKSDKST